MSYYTMSNVVKKSNCVDGDAMHFLSIAQLRGIFEEQLNLNLSLSKSKESNSNIFEESTSNNVVSMVKSVSYFDKTIEYISNHAGVLASISKLRNEDADTFFHSLGVSTLLIVFGKRLELDELTLRNIGLGGLLHDIGKLAIPQQVLRKSGKLSGYEDAIVRLHPLLGFNLLNNAASFPLPVLDICLYHHEKIDGSGYPSGLVGEAIPYGAKLAAICDVYEALTNVRPYKEAFSPAQAIDMMLRSPGHFDPTLLSLFVSRMVLSGG